MSDLRPIVVTGGAGFIGSHIVDRLTAEGRAVVVFDDLSTGSVANLPPGTDLEQIDIADPSVAPRLARLKPAAVIHAAAQPSVAASFRDPAADAQTNIVGSLNVLRGALDGGSGHFVYLTTGGALYGAASALPISEDAAVQPLSPYGWSKWLVERYLGLLASGRLPWRALRLANVYGPRQRADGEAGVVAIFCDRMRRREPISIEGDGEQTRDFVFIGDVVEAVMTALQIEGAGSINVGTGVETSINQLFAELAAIAGYTDPPNHVAPRAGDIRNSSLDIRRAEHLLGWSPGTDLERGLNLTYQALERP